MRKIILMIMIGIITNFISFATEVENVNEFMAKKDYAAALKVLDEKISENRKDPLLYEKKGDIFSLLGENMRALTNYKRAYLFQFDKKLKERIISKIEDIKKKNYDDFIIDFEKNEKFSKKIINIDSIESNKKYNTINFDYKFGFKFYGRREYGPASFFVKGNRIYVIDNINFKICVFDIKGKFIKSFGKEGQVEGEFYRPVDIAVDNQDNIYISDMSENNLRIIKYSKDYKYVISRKIISLSQLSLMNINKEGIYVSGALKNQKKIIKLDFDLNYIEEVQSIYSEKEKEVIMDNEYGNIIVLNKGKLEEELILKGISSISRAFADFSDNNIIFTKTYIADRKNKSDMYRTIVGYIDSDRNLINSFNFSPKLYGNITRIRKFFYDKTSNCFYLSSITSGEFKLLKFNLF